MLILINLDESSSSLSLSASPDKSLLLPIIVNDKRDDLIKSRIQDFKGGRQPPGRRLSIIWPIFPENYMKMKKFWARRGECVPCVPPDSSMVTFYKSELDTLETKLVRSVIDIVRYLQVASSSFPNRYTVLTAVNLPSEDNKTSDSMYEDNTVRIKFNSLLPIFGLRTVCLPKRSRKVHIISFDFLRTAL